MISTGTVASVQIILCIMAGLLSWLLLMVFWRSSAASHVFRGDQCLEAWNGRLSEAEGHFRQAYAMLHRANKANSRLLIQCCSGLAETLRRRGTNNGKIEARDTIEEAMRLLEEARVLATGLNDEQLSLGRIHETIALIKSTDADYTGAVTHLETAVALYDADQSAGRDFLLEPALGALGRTLFELKRYAEAVAVLHRYLDLQDPECRCADVLFGGAKQKAPSLCLVWSLADQNRHEEAAALLLQFIAECQALENSEATTAGPLRLSELEVLQLLHGRLLLRQGKRIQAAAVFAVALERREQIPGPFDALYDEMAQAIAESYDDNAPEVVDLLDKVVQAKERASSSQDIRLLFSLQKHGELLSKAGRLAEAETVLRRACALESKYKPDTVPQSQTQLWRLLMRQKKFKAARLLTEQAKKQGRAAL